jgi:cysteine desulfurase/selenocysteine lyase
MNFCLSQGLVYLNTGTLGPCRREVIDQTKKAWEELETLPLKYYGKWGAESLAEKNEDHCGPFF